MPLPGRLLLTGCAAGLVADQLLSQPWGLNVLAVTVVLLGGGALAGAHKRIAPERAVLLAGVWCTAALVFVLRESALARLTAAGAAATALVLASVAAPVRARNLAIGAARVVSRSLAGAAWELRRLPPVDPGVVPAPARRMVRGAIIALPLVAVFLGLFAAADPVLAAGLKDAVTFDSDALVRRAGGTALWSWLAVGALVVVAYPGAGSTRPLAQIGRIERLTVAAALTVVFATGVGLQARYLFGGDEYLVIANLTRAEYAVRGFTELLLIAGLAIPLMLWLRGSGARRIVDPRLAGLLLAMIAMLGLVLASATHRLWGYYEAYGLSEPRFFGGMVELWLAGCLVWLALVLVRGRPSQFLGPAVVAGIVTALLAGLVNPAAVIQRSNIARAAAGGGFDVEHAVVRLGLDGRAALARGLDRLPHADRCAAVDALLSASDPGDRGLWSWTWGAATARDVRADGAARLAAAASACGSASARAGPSAGSGSSG